jgi:hypothetical protein
MKSIRCYMILILLFILTSCNLKPRGWWTEGVIAVMADSTDWNWLQSDLRSTFERVVRTPHIEKTFTLKYVTEEDFFRYTEFRYLVLAATLDSKGRVGDIVHKVISDPDVKKEVEAGRHYLFTQTNQWAKDQIMIILVGKDIESLKARIEANRDFLYDIFDIDFNERLKKEMYRKGEGKKVEDRLMEFYGWNMRLQPDYFIAKEDIEQGFVWLGRLYPKRSIFVRWISGGDTTMLNQDWVIRERNRIGSIYLSGDKVGKNYLFSQQGTFLDRDAQITSGLWENDDKFQGGPFKNYTFYDPLSRRIYMIDVSVYEPEQDKIPFLRQLHIIARTFRTIFDPREGK